MGTQQNYLILCSKGLNTTCMLSVKCYFGIRGSFFECFCSLVLVSAGFVYPLGSVFCLSACERSMCEVMKMSWQPIPNFILGMLY